MQKFVRWNFHGGTVSIVEYAAREHRTYTILFIKNIMQYSKFELYELHANYYMKIVF